MRLCQRGSQGADHIGHKEQVFGFIIKKIRNL